MLSKNQKYKLSKMGYFADQQGIMKRYQGHHIGWEGHLAESRKYVMNFVKKNKPGKVAIMGSGWLLDVPIEELARFSSELILIDIHHPRQIKHKLRNSSNIVFLDYEISGGAAYEAYDLVKAGSRDLDKIKCRGFKADIEADYFVSLNILDQLDAIIIDYLQKFQSWPVEDINELRKKIQEAHINSLPKGRSCMIADIEELTENKEGVKKNKQLIFADLSRTKNLKNWLWEFDDSGDYNPGETTYFSVQAMEL